MLCTTGRTYGVSTLAKRLTQNSYALDYLVSIRWFRSGKKVLYAGHYSADIRVPQLWRKGCLCPALLGKHNGGSGVAKGTVCWPLLCGHKGSVVLKKCSNIGKAKVTKIKSLGHVGGLNSKPMEISMEILMEISIEILGTSYIGCIDFDFDFVHEESLRTLSSAAPAAANISTLPQYDSMAKTPQSCATKF